MHNSSVIKFYLVNTWVCVKAERMSDGRSEGVGVPRKPSFSSSSMSQASLVLQANSWKLEAFLDLRLLNLVFVSLGYLQRDRQRDETKKELKLNNFIVSFMMLQKEKNKNKTCKSSEKDNKRPVLKQAK